MTDMELYLMLIKQQWERIDKTNLEAIRDYNEWKRGLRKSLIKEDE